MVGVVVLYVERESERDREERELVLLCFVLRRISGRVSGYWVGIVV